MRRVQIEEKKKKKKKKKKTLFSLPRGGLWSKTRAI